MAEAGAFGRREDDRFLTGRGRYTADSFLAGETHAVFVRSDLAHADLVTVDAAGARAAPGVLAVLTGEDVADLANLPVLLPCKDCGRRAFVHPSRPALARGRVRFVGEPVALIVAETREAALDAAALIALEYAERPAATDLEALLAGGAPAVHDELPDNVCFAWEVGDAAAADTAFRSAAHVTRLTVRNQRLVANPLEPRAVIAQYDRARDAYQLVLGTQGAASLREQLAEVLRVPAERVRVVTGDVGGAFGVKTPVYPEYAALAVAAKRLGRPVKWVSTRSEAFLSEHHGRDSVMEGALALGSDGEFLAFRMHFHASMGAYLSHAGVLIATSNPAMSIAGVYRTPAIHGRMTCYMTNAAPTGPYRGAGRPEMAYFIERLVDLAAAEIGRDRVELRRRNLIRSFPYRTPTGVVYDSGDFAGVLDHALRAARWNTFAERHARSAARGKRRGIGLSCFLEATSGPPRESAAVVFRGGEFLLLCGTQASGQGHETVFADLVAKALGVPANKVRLGAGDHGRALVGGTSVASRSLLAAGSALHAASLALIECGRVLAASQFAVAAAEVAFEAGRYFVPGTDLSIELLELAAGIAPSQSGAPHPLDTEAQVDSPPTFPNGCYVAEVEVDPDTGQIALLAFICVDDVGNVIDHRVVEGQVHGGVAQGLGQALLEHCRYDAESGQLLTGSFMDYAIPRADDMPAFAVSGYGVPARTNPLGAKGAGEAGTTGAVAALVNAVVDALPRVRHLDTPLTPERVWRALVL